MTDNQPSNLLDFIVDRTHAGIFVINRDMELVLWNQFMEVHSGRKAQTLLGKNLFDEFPELPRKWLARKVENVFILKNFSFTSWEQRPYLFKFPHNRPVTGGVDCMRQNCTLMPVKTTAGEVEYVCFTLFDVTDTSIYQQQLKALTQELREVGNHDGLTQLFNRRYIEETLSKEFNRARRYAHPLTVILTDIDRRTACVTPIFWAVTAAKNSLLCCRIPAPEAERYWLSACDTPSKASRWHSAIPI